MKTLVLNIRVRRHADITRPVTWKPFKFGVGSLYAKPGVAPVNHTPALERIKAARAAFICLSGPAAFCTATLREEVEDQRQEIR